MSVTVVLDIHHPKSSFYTECPIFMSFGIQIFFSVASQCLESAYGVTVRDVDAPVRYPMPGSLQDIFAVGLNHLVSFHVLFQTAFYQLV
jgi:hypothetical protein